MLSRSYCRTGWVRFIACNSSSSSANLLLFHRYALAASFASSASKAPSMLLLPPSLPSSMQHNKIAFAHFAQGFCSSHILMFKTTISLFSLLTWLNDKPISSIPFPLKFPFHLSLSMMLTFFGNYFLFDIFLLFLYMYPNLFFFFFFFWQLLYENQIWIPTLVPRKLAQWMHLYKGRLKIFSYLSSSKSSGQSFIFCSICFAFQSPFTGNLVLQECKSNMGPFRIRLTYTHTKGNDKSSDCAAETCKRRKIGMSLCVVFPFQN